MSSPPLCTSDDEYDNTPSIGKIAGSDITHLVIAQISHVQ
jgi:hypothetical protein